QLGRGKRYWWRKLRNHRRAMHFRLRFHRFRLQIRSRNQLRNRVSLPELQAVRKDEARAHQQQDENHLCSVTGRQGAPIDSSFRQKTELELVRRTHPHAPSENPSRGERAQLEVLNYGSVGEG